MLQEELYASRQRELEGKIINESPKLEEVHHSNAYSIEESNKKTNDWDKLTSEQRNGAMYNPDGSLFFSKRESKEDPIESQSPEESKAPTGYDIYSNDEQVLIEENY